MRNKRFISILLTLCMVLTLLPVSVLAAGPFEDVSKTDWYYKEVSYVVDKGYFNGTSPTTFHPNNPMTRAMFVTVMARFDGAKVDNSKETAFSDVPVNTWYTGAVAWAAENKIVEGRGNGIFDPNTPVTREEMCTILDRWLIYSGNSAKLTKNPATITDLDAVSAYAKEAVEDCISYGVILGYPDGTFGPKLTATRAHVAALLYRLELKVTAGGGGSSSTSDPWTDYVYKATSDLTATLNDERDNWAPDELVEFGTLVFAGTKGNDLTVTVPVTVETDSDGYVKTAIYMAVDVAKTLYASANLTKAEVKAELLALAYEIAEDMGYIKYLDKTDDTLSEIVDTVLEKSDALQTTIRDDLLNYNGGYPFNEITVSIADTDLFKADATNGLGKDNFKTMADVEIGKANVKGVAKEIAKAIAKDMKVSLERHEVATDPIPLDFDIVLNITDAVDARFSKKITVKMDIAVEPTGYVTHAFTSGKHNIVVYLPQKAIDKYNSTMSAFINKMIDDAKNQPAVQTYALDTSSLNMSDLVTKYMTPEMITALQNGGTEEADQTEILNVMQTAIKDVVLSEDFDDEDLKTIVKTASGTGLMEYDDFLNKIVKVAQDALPSNMNISENIIKNSVANALVEVVEEVGHLDPEVAEAAKQNLTQTATNTETAAKNDVAAFVTEAKKDETVAGALDIFANDPALKKALNFTTFEKMMNQSFTEMGALLDSTTIQDKANPALNALTGILSQIAFNVPAGSTVMIGTAEINADDINAVIGAADAAEVIDEIQAICTKLGALKVASFVDDAQEITVTAGGSSINMTLQINI